MHEEKDVSPVGTNFEMNNFLILCQQFVYGIKAKRFGPESEYGTHTLQKHCEFKGEVLFWLPDLDL
jgi:hypothetical protein